MENSGQKLNYREALSKATQLCSQSEKCVSDLAQKCREWQLSREETEELLAYLVEEKFIDQLRYATSFVSDKFRFNKWGRIKLAYALRQKQVEERIIAEALSQIPVEDYRQVLLELLSAKARTIRDKEAYVRRNKLVSFALSHGFEAEVALETIGKL